MTRGNAADPPPIRGAAPGNISPSSVGFGGWESVVGVGGVQVGQDVVGLVVVGGRVGGEYVVVAVGVVRVDVGGRGPLVSGSTQPGLL
jgi:hypothetical protein